MTYCVGLRLERGLVFASDTRTNAGVDHVSMFKKMYVWERPGDRVFVMLSAGNLAVTQAVASMVSERFEAGVDEEESLASAETMFQAAQIVGDTVRKVQEADRPALEAQAESFSVSLILGGQVRGEEPRLFQIYSAGNFIEASADTPFFQIGEHKYGKPILDRGTALDMSLTDAVKLLLISFDSTLRSNLSVGMPIDLLVYPRDTLEVGHTERIESDNGYFGLISGQWSDALRDAFHRMPDYPYDLGDEEDVTD